jgi:hypothetical protein
MCVHDGCEQVEPLGGQRPALFTVQPAPTDGYPGPVGRACVRRTNAHQDERRGNLPHGEAVCAPGNRTGVMMHRAVAGVAHTRRRDQAW